MHVRGGLLEFAAYLLLADKLRHLLHVLRVDRDIDRRFDGIGRRRCDDPLQKPTFAAWQKEEALDLSIAKRLGSCCYYSQQQRNRRGPPRFRT